MMTKIYIAQVASRLKKLDAVSLCASDDQRTGFEACRRAIVDDLKLHGMDADFVPPERPQSQDDRDGERVLTAVESIAQSLEKIAKVMTLQTHHTTGTSK